MTHKIIGIDEVTSDEVMLMEKSWDFWWHNKNELATPLVKSIKARSRCSIGRIPYTT